MVLLPTDTNMRMNSRNIEENMDAEKEHKIKENQKTARRQYTRDLCDSKVP